MIRVCVCVVHCVKRQQNSFCLALYLSPSLLILSVFRKSRPRSIKSCCCCCFGGCCRCTFLCPIETESVRLHPSTSFSSSSVSSFEKLIQFGYFTCSVRFIFFCVGIFYIFFSIHFLSLWHYLYCVSSSIFDRTIDSFFQHQWKSVTHEELVLNWNHIFFSTVCLGVMCGITAEKEATEYQTVASVCVCACVM